MSTKSHRQLWLVTGLIYILFPIAVNASNEDCKGISIHAPAASRNDIRTVCKAAQQARTLLKQCSIESSQDLNITIQEELAHPFGLPVFAFFDSPYNQIKITDYETLRNAIGLDSVYHKIPGHELYESLIAHEVTHAISFENITGNNLSHAALEYIASVIQVASMKKSTRQILLDAFPRSSPVELEMFNEFSLYAAPQWFVANAYRHYSEMDSGCEFLRDILKGEIRFLGTPE